MPTDNNPNWGNIFKIVVYVCGAFLGLASKLSIVNRDDKLNWKTGFYNLCMAASASWIGWFILKKIGADDSTKFACSVLIARYADSFMRLIYIEIVKRIKELPSDMEQLN